MFPHDNVNNNNDYIDNDNKNNERLLLFYLQGGSFCLGLDVVLGRNTGTGTRRLERPEQDTTNIGCRKNNNITNLCKSNANQPNVS